MRGKPTKRYAIAGLLSLLVVALFLFRRTKPAPRVLAKEQPAAHHETLPAPSHPLPRSASTKPIALTPKRADERTRLPKLGTHAKRRPWVHSEYGPGVGKLAIAIPPGEGEAFPPQGFTVTKHGELLVLDSAKKRLVWFDRDGRFDRALPLEGLVAPAEVDVAADGTILVVDHRGLQTGGLLLLDSDGKTRAKLPQLQHVLWTGMYAVGNDIYYTNEGLTSLKAGDTSGSASDEATGLYANADDGVIPGHVAPDGRTVVSAGIDDELNARFFVSAIRGPEPEHLFSRFYVAPGRLLAIPYVQSDARGRIYVVLYYDDAPSLLCLDGGSGEPVGHLALPRHRAPFGTPFRQYRVVPTGGLIAQELTPTSVSYAWFDCHP